MEQLVFICLFSNVVNSFIQNSHKNRCLIERFCFAEAASGNDPVLSGGVFLKMLADISFYRPTVCL